MSRLRAMQRLVQELWAHAQRPPVEFHIGDLAWWNREPERTTRVWRDRRKATAWAWLSAPGELEFAARQGDVDALDEVLRWFEGVERRANLSTWALEADQAKLEVLQRRGYRRADGPFFVHLARTLDDVASPEVPRGYRLTNVRGTADVPSRVAAQRAAFKSTMTVARYGRLLDTWPYRPELDVVVEADGSGYVAFCLAWIDDDNEIGELEPVGTHPAHARRGLARAACIEALRRLRDVGASTAVVYARGDDEYPAPLRLYESLGFAPTGKLRRFVLRR